MSEERQRLALNPAQMFALEQACRPIADAFGNNVYLVGSALRRRDPRDIDVRVMVADAVFDRLFGGTNNDMVRGPFWRLLCSAISAQLSQQIGLPVDFQIQRLREANRDYSTRDGHHRSWLGMSYTDEAKQGQPNDAPTPADYGPPILLTEIGGAA